jgi:hypothetical protein
LTATRQQRTRSLPSERGRDLLKQVRTEPIGTVRHVLEKMAHEITGCKPMSLHHDISTAVGEDVVIFASAESPVLRRIRKRQAARRESDFLAGTGFPPRIPAGGAGGSVTTGRRRGICAGRAAASRLFLRFCAE